LRLLFELNTIEFTSIAFDIKIIPPPQCFTYFLTLIPSYIVMLSTLVSYNNAMIAKTL